MWLLQRSHNPCFWLITTLPDDYASMGCSNLWIHWVYSRLVWIPFPPRSRSVIPWIICLCSIDQDLRPCYSTSTSMASNLASGSIDFARFVIHPCQSLSFHISLNQIKICARLILPPYQWRLISPLALGRFVLKDRVSIMFGRMSQDYWLLSRLETFSQVSHS